MGALWKLAPGVRTTKDRGTIMARKRTIEIYSAGCSICEETIAAVREIACDSCEVTVLQMSDPAVAARASALGIRSLPTVVIDGELAPCCEGRGPDITVLRAAGVGQPLE